MTTPLPAGRPKRPTAIRDRHRAIIAKRRGPCHICGQPIDYTLRWPDPGAYVVDHLVPLARGGTDTLDNKAAAHAHCNARKAARSHAPIIRRPIDGLNRPGGVPPPPPGQHVGSSRVDLQACKLEYSIVSPK